MLVHGAGFLFILLVMSRLPDASQTLATSSELPKSIVWIVEAGPGGGGHGGGNRRREPPRAMELPGRDKVTVPVAAPPTPAPLKNTPAPPVELDIPAIATTSGLQEMPGVLSAITLPVTDSRGSGLGPSGGTGDGNGFGPGDGNGLGDGRDRGAGGVYGPGSGVSMPRIIHEEKPNYTGEAMRAKVQGAVFMEAVVMPDGTVGPVQITRSLDTIFGLDQEAMRTVKQWRFMPGLRGGKPVPVRVAIEMTFTLR
jgi:protein TonB